MPAMKLLTPYMTKPTQNGAGMASQTYAGMAHFAGGTPGKYCRQCRHHEMTSGKKYSRVDYETPKARPCQKTRQMGLKNAPPVPATALACKHFEEKRG